MLELMNEYYRKTDMRVQQAIGAVGAKCEGGRHEQQQAAGVPLCCSWMMQYWYRHASVDLSDVTGAI